MAVRRPGVPQLDFPQLTADIISELRLAGQVGLLDFLDEVRPVYIIGSRGGALDVTAVAPDFSSPEIFSGSAQAPAVNTVIVDTGQLPAGVYDIFAQIGAAVSGAAAGTLLQLEHRDAANAATLAVLLNLGTATAVTALTASLPLIGYNIALNERLRIINTVNNLTDRFAGMIGAKIRVVP